MMRDLSVPSAYSRALIVLVSSNLLLANCSAGETAGLTTIPLPEPAPSVEQELRSAFALPDRLHRRDAVLEAVADFLRAPAVAQMDDQAASVYLTEVAFSSAALTLPDPAFIRRQESLAVVSLPDGLGLYLFDGEPESDSGAYLISEWTAGLNALETAWLGDEIGVGYTTTSADGANFAHFALLQRGAVGWEVTWLSDEQPDWWFNARDAVLSVAADLSQLTLIGEAENSTSTFIERGDASRRVFAVTWLRAAQGYRSNLPDDTGISRQQWLWGAARPSPYATLVEFVERLSLNDLDGAESLVTDPAIVSTAVAFGLYLPHSQYEVIAASETAITFRSRQGTYIVTFQAPVVAQDAPWLINDLHLPGTEDGALP